MLRLMNFDVSEEIFLKVCNILSFISICFGGFSHCTLGPVAFSVQQFPPVAF